MADDNRKLEIELSLKAEKFKEQLKQQTRDAKGTASTLGRMDSVRNKLQTNALKLKDKISGPKANKAEIAAAKTMEKFEKKKLAIIEDQIKAVKKLNAEIAKGGKGGRGGGGQGRFSGGLGGRPTGAGIGGVFKKLGGVAGAAALGAGGAAVGAVSSQIREGYGMYSQYRQAQGGLIGMGTTMPGMYDARKRGLERGYGAIESMQQARAVAQATGQAGAVTSAQDISRITGMDVGGATDFMGQLTRAGQGFGGKAGTGGNKQLEKAIAAGFESGLDRARMPEFIQGVGKLVELQAGRQGGDVSAGGFSQMLAAMGMTKEAGMMGARGANVLSQLNEAMVRPGGGEHGQALMLQAYGFGKPGGDTNYYEALKRQETGASSVENVKALFAETESQYGGGQEQILALREMTGLSITQLEGLREGVDNLDDGALKKAIDESKPVDEQALEQMKGMGDHLKRLVKLDDRLIDIGDKFHTDIEDLQDAVNAGVDAALPLAKSTLDVTTDILDALLTQFGMDKDKDKEYSTGSVRSIRQSYEDASAKYARGEISTAEYREAARGAAGQLQSAQSSRESSWQTREWAGRTGRNIQAEMGSLPGGADSALDAILQGRAGAHLEGKGEKYQAMLNQAKMQAEAVGSTKGTADDDAFRREFLQGGEFYELLRIVIESMAKTGQTLDKVATLQNDGQVMSKAPAANASRGPQG